jgi:hypothetical protein
LHAADPLESEATFQKMSLYFQLVTHLLLDLQYAAIYAKQNDLHGIYAKGPLKLVQNNGICMQKK